MNSYKFNKYNNKNFLILKFNFLLFKCLYIFSDSVDKLNILVIIFLSVIILNILFNNLCSKIYNFYN